MATKRKGSSSRLPAEGSVEDHLHGIRVMFEHIDGEVRALKEGQEAFQSEIRRELATRFAQIDAKIEALTVAVRINSDDIRKNSDDIRQLRLELERTNAMLETKAQASALASLEMRVAALEQRSRT